MDDIIAKLKVNLVKAGEYLTEQIQAVSPDTAVTSNVDGDTLVLRVDDAVETEYGNSLTPPRPFVRPTINKNLDEVGNIIAGE